MYGSWGHVPISHRNLNPIVADLQTSLDDYWAEMWYLRWTSLWHPRTQVCRSTIRIEANGLHVSVLKADAVSPINLESQSEGTRPTRTSKVDETILNRSAHSQSAANPDTPEQAEHHRVVGKSDASGSIVVSEDPCH
jgi:hypothetical protein